MSWITSIRLKNQVNENGITELTKALARIAEMDESFKFMIEDRTLEVLSDEKDKAYKRGTWLLNKMALLNGHKYHVIWQKDA